MEDLLGVVDLALQDDRLSGPVNVVSPAAVTNADFTKALARALRRPAFVPVPTVAVKWVLGEMGREAMLASARVQPTRLIERGFAFRFPQLDSAFGHLLNQSDRTA